MSKQRLTKRRGNEVYINTDAIKRTDCCGEFGFRFCQYAVDCPNTTNRKCPILRVFDKLSDYEDKEEIEKALKGADEGKAD